MYSCAFLGTRSSDVVAPLRAARMVVALADGEDGGGLGGVGRLEVHAHVGPSSRSDHEHLGGEASSID